MFQNVEDTLGFFPNQLKTRVSIFIELNEATRKKVDIGATGCAGGYMVAIRDRLSVNRWSLINPHIGTDYPKCADGLLAR
jgi:hypothetical protein